MKIIGFAGWSGAGKTTLLTALVPVLIERGLRVSTLKHAHHRFDVDHPGKDSHAHRLSGASEVLISSAKRFALLHELRGAPEKRLPELLAMMSPVDLVLIEGFKRERHPKIEVFRAANGKPPLHPADPHILAIATDEPFAETALPQAALDDIAGVADLAIRLARPLDAVFRREEA
jgi:molybdopterin-guanine dinucleotide biosynthesis protein B